MKPKSRVCLANLVGLPGLAAAAVACLLWASAAPVQAQTRGFELNRGQTDSRVRFLGTGDGYTLFLTPDETVIALQSGAGGRAVRLGLKGAAKAPDVAGSETLPGLTYYVPPGGRGPLTGAPSYRRVRYTAVYPGIDMEYHRGAEGIQFDFLVAPQADPDRIRLTVSGTDAVRLLDDGSLSLRVGQEEIRLRRPVLYQEHDGVRTTVDGGYVLADGIVRFAVGDYDPSVPLVIDPTIVHATYHEISAPSGICVFPIFGAPGELFCQMTTTIAPGTHYTMTVDVTPTATGVLTNTFRTGSSTADPNPTNNEITSTVTVVGAADVSVSVAAPALIQLGSSISYVVTIANHGPSTATAVEFQMSVPADLVIESTGLPPLSCSILAPFNVYTCAIGDIAPGGHVSFVVTARPAAGGTTMLNFHVSAAQSDPAPGNNSVLTSVAVNRPPVVDAGPDREVMTGTSPAGVAVTASVSDPDGDSIPSVRWFAGGALLAQGTFAEVQLSWGTHVLTAVATDARFGEASDTVTITVRPSTLAPPAFVIADPTAPSTAVVSWPAVPGAEAYRVYRHPDAVTVALPPAGQRVLLPNAQLVATVSTTFHTDTGLPPLVYQHYAVVAVNGAVASSPMAAAPIIVTAAPDAEIFGFADTHNHQAANLGFGRSLIWGHSFQQHGSEEALRHCTDAHGQGGIHDRVGNFLTGTPFGHNTLGFDPSHASEFVGWPAFNSRTHQQVYHESLRRAFDGGQRLMVMHALSNKVLCEISRRDAQFSCEDMASIADQITDAKALEAFIDNQSGGPGRGWYRIAYSGTQAREIINSGKMAVVLGIEVDELFSCGRNATCTLDDVRNRLDEYYDLGVRHLFPVGHFDNAFGGAALYDTVYSFGNWAATGGFFQKPSLLQA